MTVVSNIHLNIAGWSHTTYSIGARVSNVGNAYQCITPGLSTAPPTGTGSSINNGGVAVWKYLSGIDYTTLQAWANDTARFPLVLTAPILANPWNSGNGPVVATLGTPILTLSGHTTSSSNTITIRPAAGESFQAVFQAAPTTPYAYNPANGVAFQMPPAAKSVTAANFITATSGGSLTDGSGNVYTIEGGQYATENGSPMPAGRNTATLQYYQGIIYGQDATSGLWFVWNGSAFLPAPIPPPNPIIITAANYITATSGGSITDASGNVYTIEGGQYATENGNPMPAGRNTAAMEYYLGVIYGQDATSGLWFAWDGSTFTAAINAPPTPGYFTDDTGNVWTINPLNNGEVYENGSPPNGQVSSNVAEIVLVGGVVWYSNLLGQWYSWTGTRWLAGANPVPVFATATVYAGSGGSFTDGSSNVWTINTSVNNGAVYENGSPAASSSNVTQIDLVGGLVWQRNSVGFWFFWSGSAWIPGSAPIISTNYFQIDDNYVTLDGLQFYAPAATSGGSIIRGKGTNLTIGQCIIDCYAQAVGGNPIAISGANLSITNSLIVGRNTVAGGAMVTTLGAAGAAIANNTFVHASLVSGQVALDAGSNTTTSSETSTNNIFYNYSVVYSCAGTGTPWLTSYCFYSAASFSGSNKGTDTGNSVYGLTSSAIFTGFPNNMNPVSGSAIINAGFTDTTDIPTAVDAFGASRPQGTAWDGGAVELRAGTILFRDFPASIDFKQTPPAAISVAAAIEWGRAKVIDMTAPAVWTSIVSSTGASAQMPLEILHAKTFDSSSPTEWLASVVPTKRSDAIIGIEWGKAKQLDLGVSLEWKHTKAVDVTAPAEWGGTTFSTSADAKMPLEILQSVPSLLSPWAQVFSPVFGIGPYTADPNFAIEWSAAVTPLTTSDVIIGVEWGAALAALQIDAMFPLEILSSSLTDTASAIDWNAVSGAGALLTDWPVPLEWQANFQADSTSPLEINTSLQSDMAVPAEWGIRVTFIADAAFVVEWQESLTIDASASVTWLASLATPVNIAIGLEWRASLIANSPGTAEWRASLRADSTTPVAWTQSIVAGTTAIPIEAGQNVVANTRTAIEALTNIQRDLPTSVEWGRLLSSVSSFIIPVEFTAGLVGGGINDSIPLEWTASLTVTSTMPLASGASLAADSRFAAEVLRGVRADAVAPAEPRGGVAGTIGVPLEFGHLTFTIAVNGTMPLEINSLVVGDIVVPIEPNEVHLTLGAKLIPDTWEWQHEPRPKDEQLP